jgi:hypothetical protein
MRTVFVIHSPEEGIGMELDHIVLLLHPRLTFRREPIEQRPEERQGSTGYWADRTSSLSCSRPGVRACSLVRSGRNVDTKGNGECEEFLEGELVERCWGAVQRLDHRARCKNWRKLLEKEADETNLSI